MELDLNKTIDLFYDSIYKSMQKLFYHYPKKEKPDQFTLFKETCNNILSGEVVSDVNEELKEELEEIYGELFNNSFNQEYVRKAMQLLYLKLADELKLKKQIITPDSLGLITAYLIKKLVKKKNIRVLDPFLGTGNYLYTINNNTDLNLTLFGVEKDYKTLEYAKILADLCHIEIELFHNDVLTINNAKFDLITFDAPDGNIYQYILKFSDMLKDDGYIIGLINDDFFAYDEDGLFKEELKKKEIKIIGLIDTPQSFYKSGKKSFIIFSRVKTKDENVLLAELPDLTNKEALEAEIAKIDTWIKINIDLKDININMEDLEYENYGS